jgi:catechol 2,3-dioxygenase-like lactoylglutathione lyase family enzyme
MHRIVLQVCVLQACALSQQLPVAGIHHIGIQVSDLEMSRRFYHDVLGFEPAFQLYQPDSRREIATVFFKISDEQFIELFPGLKPDQKFRINHFSLRTRDIHSAHDMLAERGVKPTDVKPGPEGNVHFDFYDPDGHRIQVTQLVPGSMHSRIQGTKMTTDRASTHLRHVAMPVADIDRALAFYHGILGFEIGAKSTEVRIPGEQGDYLELTTEVPEHLCFDSRDVASTSRLLTERGVKAVFTEPRQVTVSDPDGTRIEFMQQ